MQSSSSPLSPRSQGPAVVKPQQHWSSMLKPSFNTVMGFTFQLIRTNEEWAMYKALLASWSEVALNRLNEQERKKFLEERGKIGEKGTVCTPQSWDFVREQACVCLDLLDNAKETTLEDHSEAHYQICSPENETVGVITLSLGCDYLIDNAANVAFTITGLVKSPVVHLSLKASIIEFLDGIIGPAGPKVTEKSHIAVSSARGAFGVYQGYDFKSLGQDANHFNLNPCGCTLMTRPRK